MTEPVSPDHVWEPFRETQRRDIARAIVGVVTEAGGQMTIAQIAERAGVSRPTFYKYFPTLGSAMLFTHQYVVEELTARAAPSQRGDGLDEYLETYRVLFASVAQAPELLRFASFFDYTFRQNGLTEDELAALNRFDHAQQGVALQIFLQAQANGQIRAELDAESTMETIGTNLLGTVQRLLITWGRSNELRQEPAAVFETALAAWRSYLSPSRLAST